MNGLGYMFGAGPLFLPKFSSDTPKTNSSDTSRPGGSEKPKHVSSDSAESTVQTDNRRHAVYGDALDSAVVHPQPSVTASENSLPGPEQSQPFVQESTVALRLSAPCDIGQTTMKPDVNQPTIPLPSHLETTSEPDKPRNCDYDHTICGMPCDARLLEGAEFPETWFERQNRLAFEQYERVESWLHKQARITRPYLAGLGGTEALLDTIGSIQMISKKRPRAIEGDRIGGSTDEECSMMLPRKKAGRPTTAQKLLQRALRMMASYESGIEKQDVSAQVLAESDEEALHTDGTGSSVYSGHHEEDHIKSSTIGQEPSKSERPVVNEDRYPDLLQQHRLISEEPISDEVLTMRLNRGNQNSKMVKSPSRIPQPSTGTHRQKRPTVKKHGHSPSDGKSSKHPTIHDPRIYNLVREMAQRAQQEYLTWLSQRPKRHNDDYVPFIESWVDAYNEEFLPKREWEPQIRLIDPDFPTKTAHRIDEDMEKERKAFRLRLATLVMGQQITVAEYNLFTETRDAREESQALYAARLTCARAKDDELCFSDQKEHRLEMIEAFRIGMLKHRQDFIQHRTLLGLPICDYDVYDKFVLCLEDEDTKAHAKWLVKFAEEYDKRVDQDWDTRKAMKKVEKGDDKRRYARPPIKRLKVVKPQPRSEYQPFTIATGNMGISAIDEEDLDLLYPIPKHLNDQQKRRLLQRVLSNV